MVNYSAINTLKFCHYAKLKQATEIKKNSMISLIHEIKECWAHKSQRGRDWREYGGGKNGEFDQWLLSYSYEKNVPVFYCTVG